jgi:hypothetical protein
VSVDEARNAAAGLSCAGEPTSEWHAASWTVGIGAREGARAARSEQSAPELSSELHQSTRGNSAINPLADDFGSGGAVFVPLGESQLALSKPFFQPGEAFDRNAYEG